MNLYGEEAINTHDVVTSNRFVVFAHREVEITANDLLDRERYVFLGTLERFLFLVGKKAQHPIDRGNRFGTLACADLYARKFLRAERFYNIVNALLSARASVFAYPHASDVKRDIVGDDEQSFGRDAVMLHRLNDRMTAVVHKGLGLYKKTAVSADIAISRKRVERLFLYLDVRLFGDAVNTQKAGVVACVFIFLPGVAESDDQPLGRDLFLFSEKHKLILKSYFLIYYNINSLVLQ